MLKWCFSFIAFSFSNSNLNLKERRGEKWWRRKATHTTQGNDERWSKSSWPLLAGCPLPLFFFFGVHMRQQHIIHHCDDDDDGWAREWCALNTKKPKRDVGEATTTTLYSSSRAHHSTHIQEKKGNEKRLQGCVCVCVCLVKQTNIQCLIQQTTGGGYYSYTHTYTYTHTQRKIVYLMCVCDMVICVCACVRVYVCAYRH